MKIQDNYYVETLFEGTTLEEVVVMYRKNRFDNYKTVATGFKNRGEAEEWIVGNENLQLALSLLQKQGFQDKTASVTELDRYFYTVYREMTILEISTYIGAIKIIKEILK